MENETLWEDYRRTGDLELRNRIVEDNVKLVYHVARQVGQPGRDDYDDFVSAGMVGLIGAVEKFEPERGLAFSTFAAPRIRGAMLDDTRRMDHAPRSIRRKQRRMSAATNQLAATLDRPPRDTEVAAELEVPLEELWDWQAAVRSTQRVSMDAPVLGAAEGEDGLARTEVLVGEDGFVVEDRITVEEELDLVRDTLMELTDREREIISLYYFEELTLKQIGEILGVTESRISQIRTKTLAKLRGRLAPLREEVA